MASSDMARLIEMEKAKLRSARQVDAPYWLEPLSTAIQNIPVARQQVAVWEERKNVQRQNIMNTLTKDTNRMYNNDDVKVQKKKYEDYYNRHRGNMDENTLEIGQIHLDNFDLQIQKNDSFTQYEARQDVEMKKVIDFTNKLEIGKEYTDEDIDEFRKVFQDYTNYTEEFANRHSDRLQLTSNQHINKNLAHGVYVNKFLLDEIFEDNKIDEVEYKAYNQSIANNSIKPILDYNTQQGKRIGEATTLLTNKINTGVLEYQKTQDVMSNKIPVPGYGKITDLKTGIERPVYYKDLAKAEQRKFTNNLLDLGKEIKFDNKTQITRTGEDQLNRDYPNLFPEKIVPPSGDLSPEEAKAKAVSFDLDEKHPWGSAGTLKSYREAYKEGSMADSPSSPLYAIDGVYQYPELFKKKDKIISSKKITEEEYKTIKKDISNLSSDIKTKEKKLSQLKKNKEKGYNLGEKGEIEFDSLEAELPSLKSDLISKKQLSAEIAEFKRAFPISEEQIKKVARRFLKEKGLEETPENMKTAIVEARNYLRKDAPDMWGTKVRRGKTKVPYYMTGERMSKP